MFDLLTIIVSIIGIISLTSLQYYIHIYYPRKKEREEKAREEAEARKKEYEDKKHHLSSRIRTCQVLNGDVEEFIKHHVEKYEFTKKVGLLQHGWGQALTLELQEKMKLFYDKIEDCKNWFTVCKRMLKLVLIENMRSHLPKSKDSYLEDLFGRILIEPIIKGVKISRSWLETERPDLIEEIEKKLDSSEDINKFFKGMNDESMNEHSMNMLKEKRKELVALFRRIHKDARN